MAHGYILKKDAKTTIHTNPLFKIVLHITYGIDATSKRLSPLYAYTSVEGFHSGVEWEPLSPLINTDNSGTKFEFEVSGNMKWKLMNLGVYSDSKTFSGSITVN